MPRLLAAFRWKPHLRDSARTSLAALEEKAAADAKAAGLPVLPKGYGARFEPAGGNTFRRVLDAPAHVIDSISGPLTDAEWRWIARGPLRQSAGVWQITGALSLALSPIERLPYKPPTCAEVARHAIETAGIRMRDMFGPFVGFARAATASAVGVAVGDLLPGDVIYNGPPASWRENGLPVFVSRLE